MLTFDTNYKPDYSENRLKIIEVPDSVVLTRGQLGKIIGDAIDEDRRILRQLNCFGVAFLPEPNIQQYISSVIKQG